MVKWSGAPATEPLPFGVQSAEAPNSQLTEDELGYDPELEQSLLEVEDEPTTQDLAEAYSLFDDDDAKNVPVRGGTINRKRALNMVPTLIDNKRKRMERQRQRNVIKFYCRSPKMKKNFVANCQNY